MSLLEFFKSLPDYMNDYKIRISYCFQNECKECGKAVLTEDEEYSCEGENVADFKDGSYDKGYDFIYDGFFVSKNVPNLVAVCLINVLREEIFIQIVQFDHVGNDEFECDECSALL